MAVAPDGDCVAIGHLSASLDLGTGALPHTGDLDALLARFDASNGDTLWARTLNSGGAVFGAEVALATDRVFVTGTFAGELTVGAETAASRGGEDVYVAAFDLASGTFRWLVTGGGTGSDGSALNMGLAVSPDERSVAVCGTVDTTATFGDVTVVANDTDAFVWVLERP